MPTSSRGLSSPVWCSYLMTQSKDLLQLENHTIRKKNCKIIRKIAVVAVDAFPLAQIVIDAEKAA